MKNTLQNNKLQVEFLQEMYSTNNINRFELALQLENYLELTINECIKLFGSLPRRVFGIGKNRKCVFLIEEVVLYIKKALLQIEKENVKYLHLIETVISNNPLKYTMISHLDKESFVEELENLPNDYTIEDLEQYIDENLITDYRILAEKYNIDREEIEFLESAYLKLDLDFEKKTYIS
jgi:hypothetical protein